MPIVFASQIRKLPLLLVDLLGLLSIQAAYFFLDLPRLLQRAAPEIAAGYFFCDRPADSPAPWMLMVADRFLLLSEKLLTAAETIARRCAAGLAAYEPNPE